MPGRAQRRGLRVRRAALAPTRQPVQSLLMYAVLLGGVGVVQHGRIPRLGVVGPPGRGHRPPRLCQRSRRGAAGSQLGEPGCSRPSPARAPSSRRPLPEITAWRRWTSNSPTPASCMSLYKPASVSESKARSSWISAVSAAAWAAISRKSFCSSALVPETRPRSRWASTSSA